MSDTERELVTQEDVAVDGITELAEETVVENPYTLRPLVASDMGAICKIITAIGIKRFKECFKLEDIQGGNVEKIGFGIVFDIAGIVIENIPKAEADINRFLASLTGMKEGAIYKMPFADYGELILQVVMKEDFQDFFKRVMKLFKR